MLQPKEDIVWIVDDDDDDQSFMSMAFLHNKPSIQVLSIRDGTDLLPRLRRCSVLPRLILLDVNMPQTNGLNLLEELKRDAAFSHLPVVMFTTSSAEKDRKRSVFLGADHFLTKPNFYEQLEVIANQLSTQWQLG